MAPTFEEVAASPFHMATNPTTICYDDWPATRGGSKLCISDIP